jgi:hypothetical protein
VRGDGRDRRAPGGTYSGALRGRSGPRGSGSVSTVTVSKVAEVSGEAVVVSQGHDIAI